MISVAEKQTWRFYFMAILPSPSGSSLNVGGRRGRKWSKQTNNNNNKKLTVGEAGGHAGWGECVALLRVDELADRRKLVDFAVRGRAGAVRRLRRHRCPGCKKGKRIDQTASRLALDQRSKKNLLFCVKFHI